MEQAFWHQRWQKQEIGFHQSEINPYLRKHWPDLGLRPGDRVLVPLCGKSRDLLWLLEQGYRVLGVELSRVAVADFFAEHRLQPQCSTSGALESWCHAELEILCGDFFALQEGQVAGVSAFYDRAALVALPAPMRVRYAQYIADLLAPGSRGLLVGFDYDQAAMDGPPFAVADSEVRRLYGDAFQVEELARHSVLASHPRFQARGVTRLEERVYRLCRL